MVGQGWDPGSGTSGQHVDRRTFLRTASGAGLASMAGLDGIGRAAAATAGSVRWQFDTGDRVFGSPTVVDGTVYVPGRTGFVYALESDSGELQWRFDGGAKFLSTAPTVRDGTVHVATDENLHALDAASGREQWRMKRVGDNSSAPVVTDDAIVQHSKTGRIVEYDRATRERQWGTSVGEPSGSPVLVDGRLYAPSEEGFAVLDASTGRREYTDEGQRVISGGQAEPHTPTVTDDQVFVPMAADGFGSLTAYDAASGDQQWAHDVDGGIPASPTARSGTVYAGSLDDSVYALDTSTGEIEWEYDFGNPLFSAATYAGGRVYVGGSGGLLALDADGGRLQWRFGEEKAFVSDPIVVDGVLYVGCHDGNVYAIETGHDASSSGSRAALRATGHHDRAITGDDTDATPISLRNLRLVQTVEHTRAMDPDGRRSGVADSAPVADDLVLDESSTDVDWTAPQPPIAAGRRLAPVFDVAVADAEAATEPLTVRGRLVDGDEAVLERTATLDPAALQGKDSDRRTHLDVRYGIDVPERLPLLEMLATDPDLVDGDYPTLPAASGHDVELALDGPALEEPVTASVSIDDRELATAGSLTVGFVGLRKGAITDAGSYRFEGTPDIVGFAEESARYILDTYPVTEVTVVALESPVVGPSANFKVAVKRAANIAERKLTARIDEADAFRLHDSGRRTDDVDVSAVDVTVAVLPQEEFFSGWGLDSGLRGLLPTDDGRPEADAVLAEIGVESIPAHEIGHYFLMRYFDEPPVESDDGPQHASQYLRSSGFVHRDGSLDVRPAQQSLMKESAGDWMDAYTYRGLVESDFRPAIESESRSPISAFGFAARTDEQLARVERAVGSADEETLGATDVDVVVLREVVSELRASLGDGLATAGRYWEAPDALSRSEWQRIADLATTVEALGEEVAAVDTRYLADAETATDALGGQLRTTGRSLSERTDTRLEEGVTTVVEVTGTVASELTLDYEVMPVVEPTQAGDDEGTGRIEVRDDGSTVLASASLRSTGSGLAADGEGERLEGAVAGTVPVPEDAATVAVRAESEDGTLSTEIDATAGPIRNALEALPDRAFADDGARQEALDALEQVGDLVSEGDTDSAAEELETLYHDLDEAVASGYEPRTADEPTKDRVLARVGQQIQRFGGEVPDRDRGVLDEVIGGIPQEWLAGGVVAAALAGYALKRRLNGDERS